MACAIPTSLMPDLRPPCVIAGYHVGGAEITLALLTYRFQRDVRTLRRNLGAILFVTLCGGSTVSGTIRNVTSAQLRLVNLYRLPLNVCLYASDTRFIGNGLAVFHV